MDSLVSLKLLILCVTNVFFFLFYLRIFDNSKTDQSLMEFKFGELVFSTDVTNNTILYYNISIFVWFYIRVCFSVLFFGLTVPKFLVFFFFFVQSRLNFFVYLRIYYHFKVVRYLTGKYERYATIVCFSVHALYSHTRKFILIWYQSEPYAMSWRLKVRLGQD